ncbi:hypothetical protein HER32_06785 [Hymenobacter sp. BT18]|uniref:hypothetical protein n=1 Tax=Hymenobacter sp. BT18 TaxID=2835648 RepID=UPI00143ED886|nr:hypothetical protein [Hymenobacter sp. BT18]QIX60899.1 hypothetical protein HER32_06785 [Hymenobacter sp. BT18]
MHTSDQHKLLKSGFTIIRAGENQQGFGYNYFIKAKQGLRREWYQLESNFPSKAARDRRIKELLKNDKTVED